MSNTYDQQIREMAGMLGQADMPTDAIRQVREGLIVDHLDNLCDTANAPKQETAHGTGQKAG
jgi:hypothetical protein